MKYVKLFEEFTSKYELIKPLIENGIMVIDDWYKCESIQTELVVMGYDWATLRHRNLEKTERIKFIPENRGNGDKNYPLVIGWNSRAGAFNNQDMSIVTFYDFSIESTINKITAYDNDPREIVVFDDYFKLKHEFRGHKLKKFGV